MKYCDYDGLQYSSVAVNCTACGRLLIEDKSTKLPAPCCGDRNCSELLAPPSAKFCAQCGGNLEPPSFELWLNKIVNPALDSDLLRVLDDQLDLLKPALEIGLPRPESQQFLEHAFSEKTGVRQDVLRRWIEEAVIPLNEENNQTPEACTQAVLRAKNLKISPIITHEILKQLAPRSAASSAPIGSESVSEQLMADAKSAGEIPQQKTPNIDMASDPVRNSAKSFYQRLVAGGSVKNNLIYLDSKKSASRDGLTKNEEFLREVSHAQGAFVLFISSDYQGWVFPNPKLIFRPDSLRSLFPNLTAERFDNSKEIIEPVPVVRVGKGRWKVSPSENGTPPAQPSTTTSKKRRKPETLRPAISTPALTKSKLKPLLVSMVILTLSVVYLANVIWHIWPGPRGIQIAKDESMILVEGSTFMMGRNAGDEYERPEHSVSVKTFRIDRYEVTREDYEKFVAATNHRQPSDWANRHSPPGTARWPVTGVDWYDADAYAKWAGKRLPTEEEWEYAARANKGFRYPWGNDWISGSANANNASQGLADVDKFKGASPFGVVGMVGNAWEWTASKLTAYPGGRIPPQELGDGKVDLRVIRGGSWQSDRSSATTTYRWGWPASGGKDYSNTGFRCVKDVQ